MRPLLLALNHTPMITSNTTKMETETHFEKQNSLLHKSLRVIHKIQITRTQNLNKTLLLITRGYKERLTNNKDSKP